MRGNIYDYDTMPDAKKIFASMKTASKQEREEFIFFKKKKDSFSFSYNTNYEELDIAINALKEIAS